MARRSRESLSTSFFHVIVQGLNKEYIFEQNRYKEKYLKILNKTKEKYNIEIIAYCIMSNHAHILIYTEDVKELSNFMKNTDEDYARYYNYEEKRVGYVFKGRFLSEPIADYKYLLNCIAYIHKNPVKANMVEKCTDYLYSSYNEFFKNEKFLTEDLCEIIFGCKKIDREKFEEIHFLNKYYFMENVDITDENMKEIIEDYEKIYGQKWSEIMRNKQNKRDIALNIKERINISNRELAKYLEMNRSTINNIIKSYNN